MHAAPLPVDEAHRLAVLRGLGILDTPREERFDRITRVTAALFDVPVSIIGLIDTDRQWYKACVGVDTAEADRSVTFCGHAILRSEPMVIEDALADPFFADHPMVTGGLKVRFYAGVPLRPHDNMPVGTLCIVDTAPRRFGERDRELLVDLAKWAEREISLHDLADATGELARNEAHLAAIVGSIPESVVTCSRDGVILSVNDTGEVTFGRSRAELIGRPLTDVVTEPNRSTVAKMLTRASQHPDTTQHEHVRGLRADRAPFPMEVSANELGGSDGQVLIVVARDLSELSHLRGQLRGIIDAAGEGMVVVDGEGRVTLANPAAAQMLGRDQADLLGLHMHDAHHRGPDGTGGAWQECPTYLTLRQGKPHRSESETYFRADGTPFAVQYASTPLTEDGVITAAVIVFSDISERRQLEAVKDQLVSVVSHELRTPLTSVQGALGLVAGGVFGELPAEAASMIAVALSNTERLVRITNDILDLERIAMGQLDLRWGDHVSDELVAAAVAATTGAATSAGVHLDVDVVSVSVSCDADRIVQALTNLIGNAVKFSVRGGTVRVRTDVTADALSFVVADEGRGIPPDKLELIFERFQQVDASDRRELGGSGLGLPITRSIARQHGGDVTVTSELGVGSTFRLTIPVGPGV